MNISNINTKKDEMNSQYRNNSVDSKKESH